MADEPNVAICEAGHVFHMTEDFNPEPEIAASISDCPVLGPSPKHGNLIVPCGERLVWKRPKGAKKPVEPTPLTNSPA